MRTLILAVLLTALPAFAAGTDSTSLETLRSAAAQGQADAQYELGILYEFGYHFPDHKAAAFAWYSRAADQGNERAAQRRDLLRGEFGPADLERVQALTKASAADSTR